MTDGKNCVCDACYRHLGRKGHKLLEPKDTSTSSINILNNSTDTALLNASNESTTVTGPETAMSLTSTSIDGTISTGNNSGGSTAKSNKYVICKVQDCKEKGNHSVRRKWIVKMRRSIVKLINLPTDLNAAIIPMCDKHYKKITHLMICTLCKRKLIRNQNQSYTYRKVSLKLINTYIVY